MVRRNTPFARRKQLLEKNMYKRLPPPPVKNGTKANRISKNPSKHMYTRYLRYKFETKNNS